jgi:hypothetical protein
MHMYVSCHHELDINDKNKIYLHCFALDCTTHHLFHPYGTKSIEKDEGMTLMKELSYHDSLKRTFALTH